MKIDLGIRRKFFLYQNSVGIFVFDILKPVTFYFLSYFPITKERVMWFVHRLPKLSSTLYEVKILVKDTYIGVLDTVN